MRRYAIQDQVSRNYLTLKRGKGWNCSPAQAETWKYPETARAVARASCPAALGQKERREQRSKQKLAVVRLKR